jgi:hypothetical protein
VQGQQPQQRRSTNKPWYIAAALVAVVVVAVVSIIIATSGDSGTGTVAGVDCSDRQPDGNGFSECMREVAGAVAEKNDCAAGATGLGSEPIETPGATTATCKLDDTRSVMYMHFGDSTKADGSKMTGLETAEQYTTTVLQQLDSTGTGEPKKGEWSGDGLSGTYNAIGIAGGSGIVLFSVDDSPITGLFVNFDTESTTSGNVDDLVSYFEDHIEPGADGGA